MKREWYDKVPLTRYSGYYKVSYNPLSLLIKEIQKKVQKQLDQK